MNVKPIEPEENESLFLENTDSFTEMDDAYGYNDNITAKLGGNFTKIIEFYDNHL
ncbi:hypothetical protein M2651_05900 [Clostridium sp. SYSU_GA19001]|uniref:hypothetical protein n=1 Tax=Clostridium caldaquaticum TaxID=2940653 RepID=UPI002076F38C|nr:hypothetical protein [Clostridium caldaquaticum]MCM8710559.1 hypothetical protein [Clostridium caldaquaticum]